MSSSERYLTSSAAIEVSEVEPTASRSNSLSKNDRIEYDSAEITSSDEDFPEPTDEELSTLRKVAGAIPATAYTLCVVEFAERASYYGCSNVFSNFIQFPLPKGGNGAGAPPRGSEETAGALGQGLQVASALTLLFTFLAYTIPILGGYIADVKWGRYKTICFGIFVCGVAHILMTIGAIPSILQRGHGMAPFVISLLILAFGAGMFKSNIAPTVIDQYPHKKPYVSVLATGERVIVDPEATVQKILLTYYGVINIGAFFGLVTTTSERYVGYWLAYLEPGIVYFLCPIVLFFAYKKTVKVPPQGSELTQVFKIIGTAIKKGGLKNITNMRFWEAAKPSNLAAAGALTESVDWTDSLVDDVKRTFKACQIFLFFVVYNLNDGGIGSIQNSQAAAMTTKGAPNDLLSNFNPLTIIVLVPILNYGLYPFLRKRNINFGRISRITFGFVLAALSSVIGAILQWRVYKTSPCGYYATDCQIGDGVSPLSVWWQVPLYALGAASECFCNVTMYELAYARSPKNMRGLVMSLCLFTTALSSAVAEAVTPALIDPHLIWPFVGTAVAGFVLAALFYYLYRELDHDEFYNIEGEQEAVASSGIEGLHVDEKV
ncbi:Ptr2p [Sugiyamaella lignohabitans]|uniref:Ptr2p n=1 Tax=Sugiyamaella lignohabitans TaxID=796027 RepID=A0A167DTY0_9ASCO|nr:Ptr2p [Sugiyamaella lignohabitans]ANB13286.1 Ptr2p [Sugiyamaella lignohabitans]